MIQIFETIGDSTEMIHEIVSSAERNLPRGLGISHAFKKFFNEKNFVQLVNIKKDIDDIKSNMYDDSSPNTTALLKKLYKLKLLIYIITNNNYRNDIIQIIVKYKTEITQLFNENNLENSDEEIRRNKIQLDEYPQLEDIKHTLSKINLKLHSSFLPSN